MSSLILVSMSEEKYSLPANMCIKPKHYMFRLNIKVNFHFNSYLLVIFWNVSTQNGFFYGNNKITSAIFLCASGTAILGGVVMTCMTSDHKVLLSVAAAAGVVCDLFVSAMSTF